MAGKKPKLGGERPDKPFDPRETIYHPDPAPPLPRGEPAPGRGEGRRPAGTRRAERDE